MYSTGVNVSNFADTYHDCSENIMMEYKPNYWDKPFELPKFLEDPSLPTLRYMAEIGSITLVSDANNQQLSYRRHKLEVDIVDAKHPDRSFAYDPTLTFVDDQIFMLPEEGSEVFVRIYSDIDRDGNNIQHRFVTNSNDEIYAYAYAPHEQLEAERAAAERGQRITHLFKEHPKLLGYYVDEIMLTRSDTMNIESREEAENQHPSRQSKDKD